MTNPKFQVGDTVSARLEKILNDLIDAMPLGLDLTRGDHDEEAGAARDKALVKIIKIFGEAKQ